MNQSDYKIRNLESSLFYLQQEHANTLKLLHEEIKDLQMKNSELLFQAAMKNVGITSNFHTAEQQTDLMLVDQITKLEQQISLLSSQNESKTRQLEQNEAKLNALAREIDKINQSHQTRLTAMEMELNNKSAEIVLLSTKLHNWKKLNIKSHDAGDLDDKPSPQSNVAAPFASKIFKLRNQIVSVRHSDENLPRGRPVIARHTTISMAHPIRTRLVPALPECAVSIEERTNFSKSIRRPNILPPIGTCKTSSRSSPASSVGQSIGSNDSRLSPIARREELLSVTPDPKLVHIDRVITDINNSTASSPPIILSPFCHRNHSS